MHGIISSLWNIQHDIKTLLLTNQQNDTVMQKEEKLENTLWHGICQKLEPQADVKFTA